MGNKKAELEIQFGLYCEFTRPRLYTSLKVYRVLSSAFSTYKRHLFRTGPSGSMAVCVCVCSILIQGGPDTPAFKTPFEASSTFIPKGLNARHSKS